MKRLLLLASLVVLLYFLFSLAGLAFQSHQLGQRAAAVETEIARLKQENLELKAEVEHLASDEALEDLARRDLGYVRAGETAVVVDFGPEGRGEPTPAPAPTSVPNWRLWLERLRNP